MILPDIFSIQSQFTVRRVGEITIMVSDTHTPTETQTHASPVHRGRAAESVADGS